MNLKISQKSQEKPGGNTKTPGPKNQLYRWFVTLPYEECSASQLSQHLKSFCKRFTYQAEVGNEETHYKHWQIECTLNEKMYFNQFKNYLGFDKAHIEPTKNYFKAVNYCKKIETRFEGPFDENSNFLKVIEKLFPWQEALANELKNKCTDDRKIIWYDNKKGGMGKTQFSKYMAIMHGATVLNNGKFSDIAMALPDTPKIVIFNLPRTLEDCVNYTAIEAVKDGLIFSGKYESKTKIFDSPHVVVFANFSPELEKLSDDRWDVRKF